MKTIFRTLLACTFISVTASANATLISDLGGIDNYIGSANLGNSGSATEESWVESLLSLDVTYENSYSSGASNWTLVDDLGVDDVYYLALTETVDYFLIKLGNGGTSIHSHYLFENVGDLNYAVVDFSAAGVDFTINNISIGRMSHVGEFSSTVPTSQSNHVSSPTVIALLLSGLSMLFTRRKSHKS